MKNFILLKTLTENYGFIVDILKQILGNAIDVQEEETHLFIGYTGGNAEDLSETIRSLEGDLNTLISSYQSSTLRQQKEYDLILPLFLKICYGHYNFKSILWNAKSIDNSSELLHFILENTGIDEHMILELANSDLNVSKASSHLYLHRNTLLYKLEHLLEFSNFDLKRFYDLYILIKLIKA